jgi:hypothetical protein
MLACSALVSWYSSTRMWLEARADLLRQRGLPCQLRPVQQEVVVVEHVLRLLGLDVGAEQTLQLVLEIQAPGIARLQDIAQRRERVDHGGVNGEAGVLARKALAGVGEPELVPHQVQKVGGVLAVVDGEGRVEADARCVVAQQARADAVEGARPGELGAGKVRPADGDLAHDALGAPRHFLRCAARKGQQQDRPGMGARGDQVRDAVRQHVGLARTGAGDHQQRPAAVPVSDAVFDGMALFGIEAGQIGVRVGFRSGFEGGTGCALHTVFLYSKGALASGRTAI